MKLSPPRTTLLALLVQLAASLLVGTTTHAATIFWHGQTDSLWTGLNWTTNGGDALSGDSLANSDLIFSATGAAHQQSTLLGADVSLHSLTFNDPQPVALTGSHTLTIADDGSLPGFLTVSGGAGYVVMQNDLTLAAPRISVEGSSVLRIDGDINGSLLTKEGTGSLILAGALEPGMTLEINSGTVYLLRSQTLTGLHIGPGALVMLVEHGPDEPNGSKIIDTSALTIDLNGGALDLTNNAMVVRGTATSDAYLSVLALLHRGINLDIDGYWDGPGIRSSTAARDRGNYVLSLGVLDNAEVAPLAGSDYLGDYFGLTLGLNDTLVRFTYSGDADFDRSITATDQFLLGQGFDTGRSGWLWGDFDYNGFIDYTDQWLLDNAFNNPTTVSEYSDSDGDGMPDWWEYNYGLNPHDASDADALSASGAMTNLEKYLRGLNPNKPDTDDDGIPDTSDQHPLDPKRSEDIPLRYYGVIDLSSYVDNPFAINNTPIPIEWVHVVSGNAITLHDDGRVAFAGFGTTGPDSPHPGQAALRSAVWKNGVILTDRTTTYDNDPDDPSYHRDVVPAGVNINGDVFGNVGITTYSPIADSYAGIFSFTSGDYHEATTQTHTASWRSAMMMVSPAGTIFGIEVNSDPTNGEVATPFFGTKKFTDYLNAYRWWPYAASQSDKLIWGVLENPAEPDILLIWDPETETNEPLATDGAPLAINDQKQVVGDLLQYDSLWGDLGFLYHDGALQIFHDLLPEKFQKQLRSAIPYLITNTDAVTHKATIYFTAESYEGSPDAAWVGKEFALELKSSPAAAEQSVLYEVVPPPGKDVKAAVVNSNQVLAGAMANGDAGSKFSCEFVESTAGAINYGFDPVIQGDRNRSTGAKEKKDEEIQEWWASVTKTSNEEDGDHDPRWNQSVAVEFNSDIIAKGYKLVVPDEFKSVLKVYPETPLTEKKTTITLEGLPGNVSLDRIDAVVEVRPLNSDTAVRTLHVAVMPLITIDLGIFRVEDSFDLESAALQHSVAKSQLDLNLPKNPELIKALNGFFKQCGICFKLNHNSHDYVGNSARHFDLNNPANGILDSSADTDQEYRFFNALDYNTGKLNLIVLYDVKPVLAGGTLRDACGLCKTDPAGHLIGNHVFSFSRYWEKNADSPDYAGFLHTCAHEIGHALGLSTRNTYDPIQDKTDKTWAPGHDLGKFRGQTGRISADDFSIDVGLMWPQARHDHRWIRHEDWFVANQNAKSFR